MIWVAYVDESMRQKLDGTGIYVLAAAMIDPADVEKLRPAVMNLAYRRNRFHWRDESAAVRRKAVAAVADLPSLHLVVVGSKLDPRRQERSRRRCLERLLWSLERAGVGRVWLDARTHSLNARDLQFVDGIRDRGVIGQGIRVHFARPFDGQGESRCCGCRTSSPERRARPSAMATTATSRHWRGWSP